MQLELTTLIPRLSEVSKKAGAAILKIYNDPANLEVKTKSDDSPLTQADQAANKVICDALVEMTPGIPIISEENKENPYSERKSYTYCWLVDPLDGTKEFIKRNGEFTVNIALIHNGKPKMGFVYQPVGDVLYYALEGWGSYKEHDGKLTRLHCKQFSMQDPGLGVVCSRSHLNDETQAYLDKLNAPETVSKGSSLKFLILAEGGAHIYPRLAPTMEWDTGAAHIVLTEAGGSVIEAESGKPLQYNKENLLNPYFIAKGSAV